MLTEPPMPFFWAAGSFLKTRLHTGDSPRHWFGGLPSSPDSLIYRREGRLHQVLSLDTTDELLGLQAMGGIRLSLVFPFHWDGGGADYRVGGDGEIQGLQVDGIHYENWPYENYPTVFPKIGIELVPQEPLRLYRFVDLVMGGVPEEARSNLFAVVPPSTAYGVDLWEEGEGDAETAHIRFLVDATRRIVKADQRAG